MRKKFYLVLVGCFLIFTSCDTFWQGMAQGAAGYGGYGMYGNPYATPVGVLPYNLRPDVYAANAYQQSMATIQAQNQQMAASVQRAKEQIQASSAAAVASGVVQIVVDNTSTSSSAVSSSSSSSSSSSTNSSSHEPYIKYGYKDCKLCMGSGKCRICNGTGIQDHMKHTLCGACPNHNGKCSSCSGSGKTYGAL